MLKQSAKMKSYNRLILITNEVLCICLCSGVCVEDYFPNENKIKEQLKKYVSVHTHHPHTHTGFPGGNANVPWFKQNY